MNHWTTYPEITAPLAPTLFRILHADPAVGFVFKQLFRAYRVCVSEQWSDPEEERGLKLYYIVLEEIDPPMHSPRSIRLSAGFDTTEDACRAWHQGFNFDPATDTSYPNRTERIFAALQLDGFARPVSPDAS